VPSKLLPSLASEPRKERYLMANQFLDHAEAVLLKVQPPLTFNDIWEMGVELGLDKRIKTEGKTPWNSMGMQLFVDVRDNPNSRFIKVGKRPTRFFLKSRQSEVKGSYLNQIEMQSERKQEDESHDFTERDLHPLLSCFVNRSISFGRGKSIFTKTIHHEKSLNPGYSEWVYPDLVGFYLPMDGWQDDVFEFNKMSERNSLKQYSNQREFTNQNTISLKMILTAIFLKKSRRKYHSFQIL
jgi:hypothetical protein